MSQLTRMPKGYVVCTAAEGSCPLRERCLRSKVLRETDYTSERANLALLVVNLWNKALNPQTDKCAMYREAVPRRFAKGFKHLFDDVPKGIYVALQAQVANIFTSERTYFYCKKGTYLTSPEEQHRIAQIFKRNGLTESPRFDAFVDTYDWS